MDHGSASLTFSQMPPMWFTQLIYLLVTYVTGCFIIACNKLRVLHTYQCTYFSVDAGSDTVELIVEDCPFDESIYQVLINEDSDTDQCEGDPDSIATVGGTSIDINSCVSSVGISYSKGNKIFYICV